MFSENGCGIATLCYSGAMNTEAVGAYFRALRNRHRLSQDEAAALVTKHIGELVTKTVISNFETGKTWPGGDKLLGLMVVLHANFEEVVMLQVNDTVTPEEGQALGEKRYASIENELEALVRFAKLRTPDEFESIMQDVRREVLDDPSLLDMLKRLIPGRRKSGGA